MDNIPKSLTSQSLNDWLNSTHENPIVIDVREKQEIRIAALHFVDIYIPISKVSFEYVFSKILPKNNKIKYFVAKNKLIQKILLINKIKERS